MKQLELELPNRAGLNDEAVEQTVKDARLIQKICQRGVSGYGRELYDNANDLAAKCCGMLGRLCFIIEKLQEENQTMFYELKEER